MTPWGPEEKKNWFQEQTIKRSYADEVLSKIKKLEERFDVINYGALSYNPAKYPVFFVKTKDFDQNKKTVLITGGVHGYETSGVHGAIGFMETVASDYAKAFNIVCFPCISPWGYETINRWNPLAIDPNRSFRDDSPAEECRLFLAAVKNLNVEIFAHFDLHETTDTDNTVFRPALEKRDGKVKEWTEIPDGFYTVGDVGREERAFQKAVIDSVRKVTHIAPPDKDGRIIGEPIDQDGVIFYDMRKLSLCGGFSNAAFTTTTEVYPDSPKASPEICTKAQIAAIVGGLDYIVEKGKGTAYLLNTPDSTAVRVALWRAMHVLLDSPPHVLNDDIGIKLVAPEEGWQQRPDMHPQGTAPFRASIVTRSRFVEDLVLESQVSQYVLLGAGLDTFAFREKLSNLSIYEIDRPETLTWKEERLKELGYSLPDSLHFVHVDFEKKENWWEKLQASGFKNSSPSIVASLGVSMYLSQEVVLETLKLMTKLAPGSTFVMTFMWPLEAVAAEDRIGYERSILGAQRSGTPFVSFFTCQEMETLAKKVGFKSIEVTSTHDLGNKYFSGRTDGLRASTGEGILIAKT